MRNKFGKFILNFTDLGFVFSQVPPFLPFQILSVAVGLQRDET